MIFFSKGDLFGHYCIQFQALARHQFKLSKSIQTPWVEHKGLLVEFLKVLKMFFQVAKNERRLIWSFV